MNVEIGDFSVFPLKYLEGRAPEAKEKSPYHSPMQEKTH